MRRRRMIFGGLALLLGGCGGPMPSRLSEREVVAIAKRTATDSGYSLAAYGNPSAQFQQNDGSGAWRVLFTINPPTPTGGHFLVLVDDQTGFAKLLRGE